MVPKHVNNDAKEVPHLSDKLISVYQNVGSSLRSRPPTLPILVCERGNAQQHVATSIHENVDSTSLPLMHSSSESLTGSAVLDITTSNNTLLQNGGKVCMYVRVHVRVHYLHLVRKMYMLYT